MVNSRRSALIAATIWLTAVAGVSVTAWVAIDRAGSDITNADVSAIATAPLNTPTVDESTPTTLTPSPTTTSKPPATSKPSATSTPSATPIHSPATRRRTGPRPPTTIVAKDRTVSVAGGQVTVRCTGATIRLRSAQPENGWRVHVDTFTTRLIVVTFRSGDEEDEHQTRVTATCRDGAPSFISR
jgi:hypothetical protein